MASTYSTNLAIELIGTGDQAGSWGNTTNTNLGTLIEQAISGYVTQAVSTGTDTTITIPNGATGVARNMYIELTGTGGTNTNLIVPANKKLYFIFNNSTGAVTVKVSGQTGVSVPQGKKVVLTSNGTDIVNGLNYIADFGSNSATITQLTATSATITNLTLTSLVISNLSIASANITTLTSSSATITNLLGTTLTISGNSFLATSSGNVGIGTSSPGSKLEVKGAFSKNTGDETTWGIRSSDTTAMAAGVGGGLIFTGIYTTGGAASAFAAVAGAKENSTSGNLLGQLRFYTTDGSGINQQRAVIDSSGNLGIGTSSPGAKAEIYVTRTSSTNAVSLILNDNVTGIQTNGVYKAIRSVSNGGGAVSEIRFMETDGTNNNTSISFATQSTANALTERLRIDQNGNLGLGVTPSAWFSTFRAFQFGANGSSVFGRSENNTAAIASNAFVNSSGNFTYINTNTASYYQQLNGQHQFYTAPSGTAGNTISFTQAMTLDASGRLMLGTTVADTIPTAGMTIGGAASGTDNTTPYNNSFFNIKNTDRTTNNLTVMYFDGLNSGGSIRGLGAIGMKTTSWTDGAINSDMVFWTSGSGTVTERARITSGGDFGIGTTSPSRFIDFEKNQNASTVLRVGNTTSGTGAYSALQLASNANTFLYNFSSGYTTSGMFAAGSTLLDAGGSGGLGLNAASSNIVFYTASAEKARITSGGDFLVGTTTVSLSSTQNGVVSRANGELSAYKSAATVCFFNRNTDDGTIVSLRQADVEEGSISVSGNTVSYNAFAGSHWSQLQDGSKPDILRGTVMESINELCEWPGEQNERLPKAKISDTAGSKKVYGVFMAWDNDWATTNDMYITAVGAFICRVNGSVTVEEGDLLESNGDGTARVQADDIIRSSTIGKVTSTVKTHQYDDGSYCVPTVLYCG